MNNLEHVILYWGSKGSGRHLVLRFPELPFPTQYTNSSPVNLFSKGTLKIMSRNLSEKYWVIMSTVIKHYLLSLCYTVNRSLSPYESVVPLTTNLTRLSIQRRFTVTALLRESASWLQRWVGTWTHRTNQSVNYTLNPSSSSDSGQPLDSRNSKEERVYKEKVRTTLRALPPEPVLPSHLNSTKRRSV